MSKPIVAIVGRPNVGKSTFFNNILGKRVSIVEDSLGVTRDRIYGEGEWRNRPFIMIDTGGIEPDSDDIILASIRAQAEIAIETADLILFMVDGKEGLTSSDREVASMLRKRGREVILVVNKVDTAKLPDNFYDFYELALGEPIPISSANMLGLGDLLDLMFEHFPDEKESGEEEEITKIAVVGKPNVGKSSLINALIGEERLIVSPIAGTTRDAIDTDFNWQGEKFTLIDTAGIRRKSKIYGDIERYSVIRAISAIERSDVCLMLIDAGEGISEQDKRIAGMAHEEGKGIVVVANKWDLVHKETDTMERHREEIYRELSFMTYAPIVFTSVIERQRLNKVMEKAKEVAEMRALRIPTSQLNSLIIDATMMKQPPSDKGRALKIYYVTQIGIKPPLFAFQINSRELMHFSYARYLENRIRDAYGFQGTSIKFVFREKGGREDA